MVQLAPFDDCHALLYHLRLGSKQYAACVMLFGNEQQ